MNDRMAKTLKRVDQALKLSAELGELMAHPEQANYLAKLADIQARMHAHKATR
jgi:hypothetical protein